MPDSDTKETGGDRTNLLLAVVGAIVVVQGLLTWSVVPILLGGVVGSFALGRYVSRDFDQWVSEHSLETYVGALLLFTFLAYLIWEGS